MKKNKTRKSLHQRHDDNQTKAHFMAVLAVAVTLKCKLEIQFLTFGSIKLTKCLYTVPKTSVIGGKVTETQNQMMR